MPKFRKKPIVIEANQWYKEGDHLEVSMLESDIYKPPDVECPRCSKSLTTHGWIYHRTGLIVCPGDWIVEDESGEYIPICDEDFQKNYIEVK